MPSVGNWINFDIRQQIFYAIKNVSKVAHFIVMDDGSGNHNALFYSSRETVNLTLRPKLVITYENIDKTITKPSKLYSGIKEAYFKDGWENKKYIYIEQKKAQPCIVQFIDTYADTENEE